MGRFARKIGPVYFSEYTLNFLPTFLHTEKGLEFPGGEVGDSVRPKNLKKCWNFQWGGGLRKYFLRIHIVGNFGGKKYFHGTLNF